MKRKLSVTVGLGAVIASLAIVSSGAGARTLVRPATAAHTARARPAVKLANTLLGPILVNHSRRTVYMFTRDRRNRNRCATIRGCMRNWPAVTTRSRHPAIGRGLRRAHIGTIRFKGRLRMVTYYGYPLHTYRFDTQPAEVMNVGIRQFGGDWWALSASGKLVK